MGWGWAGIGKMGHGMAKRKGQNRAVRGRNGITRWWGGVDLVAMVHTRSYPPFLQPPNLLSPQICTSYYAFLAQLHQKKGQNWAPNLVCDHCDFEAGKVATINTYRCGYNGSNIQFAILHLTICFTIPPSCALTHHWTVWNVFAYLARLFWFFKNLYLQEFQPLSLQAIRDGFSFILCHNISQYSIFFQYFI